MLLKDTHTVAMLLMSSALMFVVVPGARAQSADRVFDQIVENWRWSHYWFGKTGMDGVYVEGKRISALVFWSKNDSRPIRGLCFAELSLCLAYSGVYFEPLGRRMPIAPNVPVQQALRSFINSGFRDSSRMDVVEGLGPSDLQSEEKPVILPVLGPPSSISQQRIPEEASREAERIKKLLGCWGTKVETRPSGCTGTLVFSYYGSMDPYWFVLRTCSAACEFKGEAVQELTRGDRGWDVTSGGYISSPKEEVERLKQQIEKAEMFRLRR